MAKVVETVIKLQIPGGQATPAPPVGPALGQHGVNIGEFVSQFNEKTQSQKGSIVPVEITVFEDRSFEFVTKQPPASDLLRKAAGVEKGTGLAGKERVGKVTRAQVQQIAQQKMPDLNASSPEQAEKIIEGTARSMGIGIEG